MKFRDDKWLWAWHCGIWQKETSSESETSACAVLRAVSFQLFHKEAHSIYKRSPRHGKNAITGGKKASSKCHIPHQKRPLSVHCPISLCCPAQAGLCLPLCSQPRSASLLTHALHSCHRDAAPEVFLPTISPPVSLLSFVYAKVKGDTYSFTCKTTTKARAFSTYQQQNFCLLYPDCKGFPVICKLRCICLCCRSLVL